MSLSLDGAHEATHDAFRGVPHTYERTLRAAEMAKEAGMHLQINTTITKSTLGEFDDFVELMKKMEPGMWSVFLLVPTAGPPWMKCPRRKKWRPSGKNSAR